MKLGEAKALIGRRIVAIDLDPSNEGEGSSRVRMHNPTITLDDGSFLRFVVEEHPDGGEYGVDIVKSRPMKVRRKKVRRRYVFRAGIRRVTVYAETFEKACLAARVVLDRRAENAGREPPVAWTLELIEGTRQP